jgi:hypothetical protein
MMLVSRLTAAPALALCIAGEVQAQKVAPHKPQTAHARVSAGAAIPPESALRRQQINEQWLDAHASKVGLGARP